MIYQHLLCNHLVFPLVEDFHINRQGLTVSFGSRTGKNNQNSSNHVKTKLNKEGIFLFTLLSHNIEPV